MKNNLLVPPGYKRVLVGTLPDGRKITTIRGSSWTIFSLRSTFAGIPKYELGPPLKGMVDVIGWSGGLLKNV